MIKFLTLRQFICPLSLFLKEIPFAFLTNAIDMKIERVLTGSGHPSVCTTSDFHAVLFWFVYDTSVVRRPTLRHFGTVEKKCQIVTAFSFKYKLGKIYIELFIFILIFFCASSVTGARCVRKKKIILYNTTRGRTHMLPFF
jgi:hypothetical protein